MADPTRGKVIAVKITNGIDGETVKITNLSRVSASLTTLVKGGDASINTANTSVAWLVGDVIQASISGRINSSDQGTLGNGSLGGGGLLLTLSGSADTSTPAVDL